MKKITIAVKPSHICMGNQRDADNCPIAKAMIDTGLSHVRVYGDEFYHSGSIFALPLPKKAQHFIARFDNGQEVKPFTFKVNTGSEQ